MEQLPVSLVIITKNEEANIARCINSVPWAKDIVVLDSGSGDRTQEIAAQLGARVFVETWRGFGPQKRRAVELAQYDWVLCLDADEALSGALSVELSGLVRQKVFTQDAYAMPRKTFHMGRWIMHGGWYPDYQVRFFHRGRCQWSRDDLHEYVESPRSRKLVNPLEHMAFENLYDQVRTNNKYSSISAKVQYQRKSKFRMHRLVIRPFVKFIECYFVKAGFLDGVPGFIIAIGAAYSAFLKYAKLWEHYQQEKLGSQVRKIETSSPLSSPRAVASTPAAAPESAEATVRIQKNS